MVRQPIKKVYKHLERTEKDILEREGRRSLISYFQQGGVRICPGSSPWPALGCPHHHRRRRCGRMGRSAPGAGGRAQTLLRTWGAAGCSRDPSPESIKPRGCRTL